eukprot:2252044-Amphidinium_carterae.1
MPYHLEDQHIARPVNISNMTKQQNRCLEIMRKKKKNVPSGAEVLPTRNYFPLPLPLPKNALNNYFPLPLPKTEQNHSRLLEKTINFSYPFRSNSNEASFPMLRAFVGDFGIF